MSDRGEWRFGGMLRMSGEGGAEFSDATQGGGLAGFQYKSSDTLKLGLLVGALSQIEANAAVVALPLVDWQMADNWNLKLGMQDLGGMGYGPELTWAPSDTWDFGFGASYQKRRYRLDTSGPGKGNVGEETAVPVYVRIGYRPSPASLLELTAGAAFGGEIRVGDSGGSKLFKEDYDPAAIIGLRGQIRF